MTDNSLIKYNSIDHKFIETAEELNIKGNFTKPGYLALLKILNYEELDLLSGASGLKEIINELNNIISNYFINSSISSDVISFDKFFLINIPINYSKDEISDIIANLFYDIQSQKNYCNLFVECSIVTINYPKYSHKVEELIKKLRLFINHHEHIKNFHTCYDESKDHQDDICELYQKANLLRHAILEKKVKFAFQPILNCETGEVNHHECLLRIIDNNDQLVTVGPIIPIVEKLGFINIVDETVFNMVIDELKKSQDITLAINISNVGAYNQRLIAKMKQSLKDRDIASRLIIEITETAAQEDLECTRNFLNILRSFGVSTAIDDFGAGYTSFKQLKSLVIDYIKIDGAFIRDVVENNDNKFFVEMIVKMAHQIGAKTIAEYVENGEVAKFLIDINVDYMQGNYLSPAAPRRSWVKE